VLDVDYHVKVVEQHPPALALALTAHRLGPGLAQLVLDVINDRLDLAIVGCRAEQERVGDDKLLAHVVGDDVGSELVGRGSRGDRH
jgi:hypothetical protein